jgi:S-methylmethionine-dependent homocysteine/selenocysteine methylase
MLEEFIANARPLVLTDGGIETTLIHDDAHELPHFAAFHLLGTAEGRAALTRYYERYIAVARRLEVGFILESPTWRSSADWGDALGYSKSDLAAANRAAIGLMQELRDHNARSNVPMLISGCVGPRGDGYVAGQLMRPEAAEAYHAEQIRVMAAAGAEVITAITMTHSAEAIGITRAAKAAGRAAVISFTVETDGRLPSGETLEEAITAVDAATQAAPGYYMINCAHPTHFASALDAGQAWTARIGGIRVNASCKSHAELNEATELDRGDIPGLARQISLLRRSLPQVKVIGGCCGTDHRHVAAIAEACIDRR